MLLSSFRHIPSRLVEALAGYEGLNQVGFARVFHVEMDGMNVKTEMLLLFGEGRQGFGFPPGLIGGEPDFDDDLVPEAEHGRHVARVMDLAVVSIRVPGPSGPATGWGTGASESVEYDPSPGFSQRQTPSRGS